MIGKVLFQVITTDSVLSGIVRNRVYPILMPHGKIQMPAIVYNCETICQPLCDGQDIDIGQATIAIFANTYEQTILIASRIRKLTNPLKGIIAGVEVQEAHYDGDREYSDDELQLYVKELDISMKTIFKH